MKVTFEDIQQARKNLEPIISRTDMRHSISASSLLDSEVYFKFENGQRTGSFKFRGASNKILNLTAEERAKGVVASSAGNHAQGVALSAKVNGVKSVIVMPETAPISKTAATKGYGAEVVQIGQIYDDAYAHARKLEQEHGYTFVHPYEDPFVIAGQGTIGIEILEKVPDLDTVIVPIGGGGLISGIALAVKHLNPKVRVIGVQSDRAASMSNLYNKKENSSERKSPTIADGIAIKYPSQTIYDNFISKYVDQVVTVTDDEISEAIVFLMERVKTVAEGSGAAAMAAAMSGKIQLGAKSCIIISGGNIDLNLISKIIERGLSLRGRICELSVIVDDLPGNLSRLTQTIGDLNANILDVRHDRVSKDLSLRQTRIAFVLETTSLEHIEKIKTALASIAVKVVTD